MFRLITSRRLAASTPVTACGYMNRASAEPSASVAYAHSLAGVAISEPNGLPVTGLVPDRCLPAAAKMWPHPPRSEEHTSELQSRENLVCRLLLEKTKKKQRL